MLNILYEDRDILVAEKPSGVESQSAKRFEPDMVSQIRNYIMYSKTAKDHKICTELSTDWGKLSTKSVQNPGKSAPPYVGVIHRLDKPVSGVMVYAKNRKAAAALSDQVQKGAMDKIYYAVVCGKPVDNVGNFVDYLRKDGKENVSVIVDKAAEGAKRAELEYQVEAVCRRIPEGESQEQEYALVRIHLLTGRHHQIRVQFAGHGLPLWGDNRYHPEFASGKRRGTIALCAAELSFTHPVSKNRMTFSIRPQHGAFSWFSCSDF